MSWDNQHKAAPTGRLSSVSPPQREFITLMSARVSDAELRKPFFVDAATDLVTTCQQMAAQGITDALVRRGDELGVFTTTRLRDALLEDKPPAELTVGEFASFRPLSVDVDDQLYDAMNLMLRHQIHRVLVRDHGRVTGILSQLDLLGFLSNHSHLLLADIEQASDIDALSVPAHQVESLIRGMNADGIRIEVIAGMVGRLNRQIFRRLWDILAPEDIRANSCLIVMGSEGRSEQVIRTDQDNGLILRDGYSHPDLQRVTEEFTAALIRFGYPPCPGGIMVNQSLWRQSQSGFQAALRDWIHGSTTEGPMNLAIFLDADAVAGDSRLLADTHAYLRRLLVGGDTFYARFAAAIQQFGNDGSWWRRLPGLRGPEAAEIDVKKLGIFPVVHGVRTLALQYGVTELGTSQRLQALADGGHLRPALAADLTEALHRLMGLKLNSNLAQIKAGRAPDNTIRLGDLGRIERQSLRDALAIVRDFRQWMAQHYRLDAL